MPRHRRGGDAAQHAAEDAGVERVDAVPVEQARRGRPDRRSRSGGSSSRRARARPRTGARRVRGAASRPRGAAGGRARSRRRARNRARRRGRAARDRAGRGAGRRRRRGGRGSRAAATAGCRSTSRCRPPMRRMGAKAAAGGTGTVTARESTSRVPKRTPPYEGGSTVAESASFQRVAAIAQSSRTCARASAAPQPHRTDREDAQGGVVAHDGGVAQALDQLAADARVDRRGEPEPEARQVRRQHGHRDPAGGAGRAGGRTRA